MKICVPLVTPEKLETDRTTRAGVHVKLRPVKIRDESILKEFFYSLSDRSIYRRFISSRKDMPHERLQEFVIIDYTRELVILAIVEREGQEVLAGVGQYGIHEGRDLLVALLRQWDFVGARRTQRLKALRALADLGDASVLARIDRFFWNWRVPLVSLEEPRAAYRALEAYPEAARGPYLERGLASSDAQIREVCRRILAQRRGTGGGRQGPARRHAAGGRGADSPRS